MKGQNKHDHAKRINELAKEFKGGVSITRGNHLCLQIGTRKFFTSLTPGCCRATTNFEKLVRREMRSSA